MLRTPKLLPILLIGWPFYAHAQSSPELRQILERLDRLERENHALADEVHALRAELAASRPAPAQPPAESAASTPAAAPAADIPERLEIVERRVEEQAQTKVEAAQKFPIRLTGMALFNAFSNSRDNADSDYPGIAQSAQGSRAGATFRQTVLGLEYRGPQAVWGGRVSGNVYMDFYGTPGTPLNETMRLRTGQIQVEWNTRSVMVGLEKPIFNPREPSSLARVGVSPLTGAGNLWLWIPQVRFEQDFRVGETSGVRAQVGVVQTREVGAYNDPAGATQTERARPGLEGRFEWYKRFDDDRRIEIAPGFHTSTSHAYGGSIPSNLFSLDWMIAPVRRVQVTGAFYTGQNVAHLGTGSVRQGFSEYNGFVRPVHSIGGWSQLTLQAASRLSFHLFSGQMDDRNSDLRTGALGKNLVFGGNFFYNLAANVIVSLEATQTRSTYIGTGLRHNNHYDLAVAYLF